MCHRQVICFGSGVSVKVDDNDDRVDIKTSCRKFVKTFYPCQKLIFIYFLSDYIELYTCTLIKLYTIQEFYVTPIVCITITGLSTDTDGVKNDDVLTTCCYVFQVHTLGGYPYPYPYCSSRWQLRSSIGSNGVQYLPTWPLLLNCLDQECYRGIVVVFVH